MNNTPRGLAPLLLVVVGITAQGAEYARPELLVERQELIDYAFGKETTLSDDGLVVLDLRAHAALPTGEPEPGWFWLRKRIDPADWVEAFGEGSDRDAWSARIGALVPNPDATVVVADGSVTPNAARVWWILRYWGVRDVRLFNGSEQQLQEASMGMMISSFGRTVARAAFVSNPQPDLRATRADVTRAGACLIDARSNAEVAAGVIPGAAHADWARFVDSATGKMRPADELARLLGEAGFDPAKPAVAYCRSGGRASVVAFAMELMGGEQVANYYGSWNDWTRDPDAPIASLEAAAP